MKAVAYVRLPDRGQSEAVAAYASDKGVSLDAVFTDDPPGEPDSTDRPGWIAMLKHCRDHKIKRVLVCGHERISREFLTGMVLVQQCEDAGARVIDCHSKLTLTMKNTEPHQKFVTQMLFNFSQLQLDLGRDDREVAL